MNIAEKILRAKADYDEVFEAGKKAVGEVLKFTDVSSTTYRSIVPNGVEPFARVNKIGGMTYKSKNLFEYPYADTTWTSNGITFTDNGDGSITLNGANNGTGNSVFYLSNMNKPTKLSAGTYVCNRFDDDISITIYDGTNWFGLSEPKTFSTDISLEIYIEVRNGSTRTFSNVTIYPMLNEGTTPLPYEPYFEGLRSASVSELKSEGVNLFNAKNITSPSISVNEDGSKILLPLMTEGNGYIPLEQKLSELCPSLRKGDTVYLKYDEDVTSGNDYIYLNKSDKLWFRNASFTITEDDLNSFVGFYGNRYADGYTEQVTLSNFRVVRDFDTEFNPYRSEDTLAIPEAVKSIDGYGLGVNSEYYNYIDYKRKVFVQRVRRVVFDGTENWFIGVTDQEGVHRMEWFSTDVYNNPSQENSLNFIKSNYYDTLGAGWNGTYGKNRGISTYSQYIQIYDEDYNTNDVSLWKAHLKELYDAGNPLEIVFALATPIETDISAYLTDEYIEVEGGGTITAVNEFGYDVPTNISYLIDTQGG